MEKTVKYHLSDRTVLVALRKDADIPAPYVDAGINRFGLAQD